MSMASNIKENFRLLDMSTDEESEDLHLEIAPSRKKKIARRDRGRSVTRAEVGANAAEAACALRWAARGVTLAWLIALTWLAASLYDQVTAMDANILKVSTSSNSVNDELQQCHTSVKELRGNASALSGRVAALELEHKELAQRVEAASGELAAVAKQLAAAPSLADTPRRMAELQRTVADFGSQIQGFDSALALARKQSTAAGAALEEVKAVLQRLEVRANQTAANITERAKLYRELKQRVDDVNGTLVDRIDVLQARIENTTQSSTTTSTTTTTTAAAPTPAPGPPPSALPPAQPDTELNSTAAPTRGPVKPNILQ